MRVIRAFSIIGAVMMLAMLLVWREPVAWYVGVLLTITCLANEYLLRMAPRDERVRLIAKAVVSLHASADAEPDEKCSEAIKRASLTMVQKLGEKP